VFVGLVGSVDPPWKGEQGHPQLVQVLVERGFKGVDTGFLVTLNQLGGCSPRFRPGERGLFYVKYIGAEDRWEAQGCLRSTDLNTAGDDLRFLHGLPESRNRTRLSGTVLHYEDTPEAGVSLIRTVPGLRVEVVGPDRRFGLETGEDGAFEVYDLPPGRYEIRLSVPTGLKLAVPSPFGRGSVEVDFGVPSVIVELSSSDCAGTAFSLISDTAITGKILGDDGSPLDKACVKLMPARGAASRYFHIGDCTEANEGGVYFLDGMPPGDYFLRVSVPVRESEAKAMYYYPGVSGRDRALAISVPAGGHLHGIDIVVPLPVDPGLGR
jgi:hypothetical protein